MKNKEDLIKLSKQYFDGNKNLDFILASSDGNFFYTKADASYHVAKNDVIMYMLTRKDLAPKVETEIKEVKIPVKKVIKKAK